MLHIILFQPEIPQNTGNIGRLSACTRSRLHLIHPLGFKISDKHLKRSGMDYWYSLDLVHHDNWESFVKHPQRPKRIWMFTTKATKTFWDASYEDEDGLLFGSEGAGCPLWLHESISSDFKIKIPHYNEAMRSLNLSTSAGIATYEALRQVGRVGNGKV